MPKIKIKRVVTHKWEWDDKVKKAVISEWTEEERANRGWNMDALPLARQNSDPKTGNVDIGNWEAVYAVLLSQLGVKHPPEILAFIAIVSVYSHEPKKNV